MLVLGKKFDRVLRTIEGEFLGAAVNFMRADANKRNWVPQGGAEGEEAMGSNPVTPTKKTEALTLVSGSVFSLLTGFEP